MEEFNNKITEILEIQNHLSSDNWKWICHALFLQYKDEVKTKEMYKKYYEEKT